MPKRMSSFSNFCVLLTEVGPFSWMSDMCPASVSPQWHPALR